MQIEIQAIVTMTIREITPDDVAALQPGRNEGGPWAIFDSNGDCWEAGFDDCESALKGVLAQQESMVDSGVDSCRLFHLGKEVTSSSVAASTQKLEEKAAQRGAVMRMTTHSPDWLAKPTPERDPLDVAMNRAWMGAWFMQVLWTYGIHSYE